MDEAKEQAERALLADIRDLKVADDPDDLAPHLDVDGEQVRVADAVWALYRRHLCYQPLDSHGWRLTQRGLDVLEGRVPHGDG
jgi:hypothetical protein